jgi:hypothetical protein
MAEERVGVKLSCYSAVRFSPEDYAVVVRVAKKCGRSISSQVRLGALEYAKDTERKLERVARGTNYFAAHQETVKEATISTKEDETPVLGKIIAPCGFLNGVCGKDERIGGD